MHDRLYYKFKKTIPLSSLYFEGGEVDNNLYHRKLRRDRSGDGGRQARPSYNNDNLTHELEGVQKPKFERSFLLNPLTHHHPENRYFSFFLMSIQ